METVFDYNITDEEREHIGISGESVADYASYDEETANLGLAHLFWLRGDMRKAEEYAERLPLDTKWDFYRTVTHP